jgi:hypothetical protein
MTTDSATAAAATSSSSRPLTSWRDGPLTGGHPANITGSLDEPARNPIACGALGSYDRAVVKRIADALPTPPREVHADRRSCLWLDREPLRWRAGLRRGLAWSERIPAPDPAGVRSWRDAATALDACGLTLGPRDRAVHSSVSGTLPVYWVDHGDATYFATRVDALARGTGARFDLDWDAWAAIFSLRLPLGERTPFRQIRRLRQFAVLERSAGAGAAREEAWPWAAVAPTADVDEAADAFVAGLLEQLALLRPTGATVLLSGGLDSRILLAAADDAGLDVAALTAVADDGVGWEAGLALDAARAAGASAESFGPDDAEHYRRLWLDHLEASDFQFLLGSFVLPLFPRAQELGRPALDGLAIDVLAVRGGRFYTPEMLDPPADYGVGVPLWESLRERTMKSAPERALEGPYAAAMLRSSRRQFRREAARFRGNRNQTLLTAYSTRMRRGVATLPKQTIGRHVAVFTPGATDRIARAMLSVDPWAKRDRRLYDAIFSRLASPAARMPNVANTPKPDAVAQPLRARFSAPMVDLYERALRDGPLSPILGKKLSASLREGKLGAAIHGTALHRATMAVTALHHWAERYESVLRPVEPQEMLEPSE